MKFNKNVCLISDFGYYPHFQKFIELRLECKGISGKRQNTSTSISNIHLFNEINNQYLLLFNVRHIYYTYWYVKNMPFSVFMFLFEIFIQIYFFEVIG